MPAAARRSFHLHVFHSEDNPYALRWIASRSVFKLRVGSRSGQLAGGTLDLMYEGGTPHEVAIVLLTAALREMERQVRDGEASPSANLSCATE